MITALDSSVIIDDKKWKQPSLDALEKGKW